MLGQSPFAGREKAAAAVFAERFGVELPEHFGDPVAEYEATRRVTGLVDLSFRGVIELTGSDRLRWLNGQITNEVKDLKAFQALMKPVYASVEQQVGKEFMDRLTTAAAQAAK